MRNSEDRAEIDVDYIGIYVTARGIDKESYEIAMADSLRFGDEKSGKTTWCRASFREEKGSLIFEFRGVFQERPIEMTTKHVRVDIYINARHRERIVLLLEESFRPKKRNKDAPDPTIFRKGKTRIPLERGKSSEIYLRKVEVSAPLWSMVGESKRAFLDKEIDSEFDRVQIHIGIPFTTSDLRMNIGASLKCGDLGAGKGVIEIADENIDILHTYLSEFSD